MPLAPIAPAAASLANTSRRVDPRVLGMCVSPGLAGCISSRLAPLIKWGVSRDPVIVVGAGIGGLACALALMQRGIDVAVYEQAPELREIGAGVQIAANGTRV